MDTRFFGPLNVYQSVEPVLKVLQQGLEGGVTFAHFVAEMRKRDFQPGYEFEGRTASDLARSYAKEHLREQLANSIDISDAWLEPAAMIGIKIRFGQYQIWVWKSKNRRMPYPGGSRRKRRYLNQPTPGYQLPMDIPDCPMPTRLVVLWNVDADFNLKSMYLVLPKAEPEKIFTSPQAWWTIAMPHFVEQIEVEAETGQDTDDLPYEIIFDDEADRRTEGG